MCSVTRGEDNRLFVEDRSRKIHCGHEPKLCICLMLQAQPVLRAARNWACMTWKWEPHLWSCMRHSNFELPIALVFICIWHHKTHTRTGGPGSECVELIWAYAPVQFTPHSFVSPSFIGIRSFQDSEIRVYHGISWISQMFDYRTFQDRVAQLPIICLSGFCHKSLSQTRSTRSSMQTSFSLIRPTSGRNGYMMFFNMF